MKDNVHTTTSPKRSRDKTLAIRLSGSELYKFNSKFALAHQSGKAEFLMRLLEECPINIIEDIVPLRADLKKLGTNINQIAKVLNSKYYTDDKIDLGILSQLRDISTEISTTINQIKDVIINASIKSGIK